MCLFPVAEHVYVHQFALTSHKGKLEPVGGLKRFASSVPSERACNSSMTCTKDFLLIYEGPPVKADEEKTAHHGMTVTMVKRAPSSESPIQTSTTAKTDVSASTPLVVYDKTNKVMWALDPLGLRVFHWSCEPERDVSTPGKDVRKDERSLQQLSSEDLASYLVQALRPNYLRLDAEDQGSRDSLRLISGASQDGKTAELHILGQRFVFDEVGYHMVIMPDLILSTTTALSFNLQNLNEMKNATKVLRGFTSSNRCE